MSTRRFSVVINTDNRADSLAVTLDSLSHLDHTCFEVVVVRGPTVDGTAEVLKQYEGKIKVGSCPNRNLSQSRNIGIALASGEIVAFIDDDAYPDPQWLDVLDRAYDDPEVAAAGGPVWDWTGTRLQVLYSIAYQLGDAWVENQPGIDLSSLLARPGTSIFTYPIGTNSSFRRDRVIDIGGFDEEFEYGWDDVDLCHRLIERGWVARVLEDGFVHHKSLPSDIRGDNRALRNLRVLLKNKAHYTYKHGSGVVPLSQISQNLSGYAEHYRSETKRNIAQGLLDDTELETYEQDVAVGFDLGYEAFATGRDRRRLPSWFAQHERPFLPFTTRRPRTEKLHLCFFTSEYPPGPVNGIGRVTHELASGLGRQGHEVHVLTRGEGVDRIDFEDHAWVHRMVPKPHAVPVGVAVPQKVWDYSATLFDEALRIDAYRSLDLVEAPNWDSEGIAVLLDGRLPLVVELHTPLATVVAIDTPLARDAARGDTELAALIELERLGYQRAPHLLAWGNAIVGEIENAYDLTLETGHLGVVPHGLPDRAGTVLPATRPGRVNVLFVGRLEDRKGIDTLLDAIPDIVATCPEADFTIAGDDTRPMADGLTHRQRFEASPAWPGVADHVQFVGRVDDLERDRLYSTCDVFVAPSRFESFGLILVEAMMFAKPVVACDAGGMAEIVANGSNGLLVPPGNANALRDAIVSLVRSPELRDQMGAESRNRYERLYRVEAMVDGVNRYYDKILHTSTASWRRPDPDSAGQMLVDPSEPTNIDIAAVRSSAPSVVDRPSANPPVSGPAQSGQWLRGLAPEVAERLRCPRCGRPVVINPNTLTASGEVKTGRVRCERHGDIAAIDQFKIDFVSTATPETALVVPLVVPDLGERRVRADDDQVIRVGNWTPGAGGLLASAGVVGDALELRSECTDALVRLWRQPAGGIVDLFVDGVPVSSVDLYQAEGSQMLVIPLLADLQLAQHHLAARARGSRNPLSAGGGVYVEEFVLYGPAGAGSEFLAPSPINRGNPYSVELERWLRQVPEGEPVLEVGGGDRRRSQAGHLNLEFLKFELADAYGDIEAIPFADDTFAATWTQAVFEHVANPFQAAAELVRVTRPGGLVLTEVAFMQPLHAVPYHFFNMTTWGLQELFRSCEVLECDWFGDLSGTIEWLINSVNLATKVDPAELAQIMATLRSYDSLVDHDELRPAASVVYLAARKPISHPVDQLRDPL
jgi:hypothetical protein